MYLRRGVAADKETHAVGFTVKETLFEQGVLKK